MSRKRVYNDDESKSRKLARDRKYYSDNKESESKRLSIRREKIKKFIVDIKSVPCMDCGQSYPSYVMDFDHRGDKSFTIAKGISNNYSIERLLEEINKCDIVCSNCHRIRTWSKYD